MTKASDQSSLQAAVELGFLTDARMNEIRERGNQTESVSGIEFAVRRGYLNRKQLEILDAFENPLSVAPGYRIDGFIGKGGSGVVYLATQLGLDRTVALKTISQTASTKNELALKRFEREAKIIGQLRHPNIVTAIDFGAHTNHLFLVMEFVDGSDAEKHLIESGPMNEVNAWHIARQVCHALSYANELGVIHRDIKPGNLILSQPPTGSQMPAHIPLVKVADFGLARFQEPSAGGNITIEAALTGTPYYMSPEQTVAQTLDHRSDIYALGATLWHLILNEPPIKGESPMEIISNRMNRKDEWLERCPVGMSEDGFGLIRQMCRFHVEDRIGDFASLDEQINEHIGRLEDNKGTPPDTINLLVDGERSKASITFVEDINSIHSDVRDSWSANFSPAGSGPADSKKPEDGDDSFAGPGRFARLAVLVAAAAIGIGALYYFLNPFAGNLPGRTPFQMTEPLREWSAPYVPLFNGLSLDARQKSTGTWEVAEGLEEGAVLAGNGTRDFKCAGMNQKPFPFYRFECGFRHHESELIEFRVLDENDTPRLRVVISREKAVLFSGNRVQGQLMLETFDDDSFGYPRMLIESQPNYWEASINTQRIGTIPKTADQINSGNDVIRLSIEGAGSAHFETIRIRPYKAPQPATR